MQLAALAVLGLAISAVSASVQQSTREPRRHPKVESQAQLEKEAKISMSDARALASRTVLSPFESQHCGAVIARCSNVGPAEALDELLRST